MTIAPFSCGASAVSSCGVVLLSMNTGAATISPVVADDQPSA